MATVTNMPACGCPPRPPRDAPWRETCKWHIEHYAAARDGAPHHRKGHPKVCAEMVDNWLDAMLCDAATGGETL